MSHLLPHETTNYFGFLQSEPIPQTASHIERINIALGSGNGIKDFPPPMTADEIVYSETGKARRILEQVCYVHEIDVNVLTASRSRKRDFVFCRQQAMYFIKKYCKLSLKKIGKMLRVVGNPYDHSTVLHSCSACQDDIDAKTEKDNFYHNYKTLDKIFKDEFGG